MIFFHLFKAKKSFFDSTWMGSRFDLLRSTTKMFEVYSYNVKNFKDQYYISNPLMRWLMPTSAA